MNKADAMTQTVAETYLDGLVQRGIKYVFANAGTDFAPIIEALVVAGESGRQVPNFVTVPHENVAVSMAHGYFRTCGELAGVMVHVTVGTANALCALMNANRDNVPILMTAGRTPYTEVGHHGSRVGNIHWGQENFDQGGMLREQVKWDYELRPGQPAATVVGRAIDIAMSEPRGPVYLCLPREVLGDPNKGPVTRFPDRELGSHAPVPSANTIDEIADVIAKAEMPLILTAYAGRDPASFEALGALADEFAIPVAQPFARDINIASGHAMNLGGAPGSLFEEADVVIVLDSEVPWVPMRGGPDPKAKVIHISADPFFARYPFRGFEADIAVAGATAPTLQMLRQALNSKAKGAKTRIDKRRKTIAAIKETGIEAREKRLAQSMSAKPMDPAWIAKCVNDVKGDNGIVVNELGVPFDFLDLNQPRTYIAAGTAGGLGLGLGAALGAKLAAPEANVISIVGDGSYMFGNPVPAHYVSAAEKLPTLTIVANNHRWHAVAASTIGMYPDGRASKSNAMPLVALEPSPKYEAVAEACGAYGESVSDPAELPKAMERAMKKIAGGTQALLNVDVEAGRRM